jgi:hypothetical protein
MTGRMRRRFMGLSPFADEEEQQWSVARTDLKERTAAAQRRAGR